MPFSKGFFCLSKDQIVFGKNFVKIVHYYKKYDKIVLISAWPITNKMYRGRREHGKEMGVLI